LQALNDLGHGIATVTQQLLNERTAEIRITAAQIKDPLIGLEVRIVGLAVIDIAVVAAA